MMFWKFREAFHPAARKIEKNGKSQAAKWSAGIAGFGSEGRKA